MRRAGVLQEIRRLRFEALLDRQQRGELSQRKAANRWLAEVYLPDHNVRFAVPAEQDGSAFVADAAQAWRQILCVQEERLVGNDNTVKWRRLSLQIPPSPLRPHFVRTKVRVHEYPTGCLAVFLGPHRPADNDAAGRPGNAHALAA